MNIENAQILASKINQKITIFKHNDFGFPVATKCTLNEVTIKDYAQYKNSLFIVFTPKGKRTKYRIILHGYESVLFYDDHIELDKEMYTQELSGGMKQSELSFSKNYIENAKNSTDKKPFLELSN
jgi:hypothetical protein